MEKVAREYKGNWEGEHIDAGEFIYLELPDYDKMIEIMKWAQEENKLMENESKRLIEMAKKEINNIVEELKKVNNGKNKPELMIDLSEEGVTILGISEWNRSDRVVNKEAEERIGLLKEEINRLLGEVSKINARFALKIRKMYEIPVKRCEIRGVEDITKLIKASRLVLDAFDRSYGNIKIYYAQIPNGSMVSNRGYGYKVIHLKNMNHSIFGRFQYVSINGYYYDLLSLADKGEKLKDIIEKYRGKEITVDQIRSEFREKTIEDIERQIEEETGEELKEKHITNILKINDDEHIARKIIEEYPKIGRYPEILDIMISYDSYLNKVIRDYIYSRVDTGELDKVNLTKFRNFIINLSNYTRREIEENIGETLSNFMAKVEWKHNGYPGFEKIERFNYLRKHYDKKVIQEAMAAVDWKNVANDEIWKLIERADRERNWHILEDNKKIIMEIKAKREMAKNPELFIDIKKKEEGVMLLNVDIGGGYKFRVVDEGSGEHLTVGIATNCCQRIGGAGEAAAIDALRNPWAGTLVLEKNGILLSQSYFHYVEREGKKGYILDNVEVSEAAGGEDLDEKYYKLAIWARDKLGVDFFECGTGYNNLNSESFGVTKWEEDPREFEVEDRYTDWRPDDSLNLFEYNPTEKKKREELIREVITYPYREDIGRVRSDKYHGKIKELKRKIQPGKKEDEKDKQARKERRRALEKLLSGMGVSDVGRALSNPKVREGAEKTISGEWGEEQLKELMSKYRVAEVAMGIIRKMGRRQI